MLFSCKKDKSDTNNKPIIHIYKGTPNKEDGLQADVYDPNTKFTTYFYGSFNSNGIPDNIKSMVLENSQSDTLYNYVFDNNNRLLISYGSLKNGTKLNSMAKMTYLSADSAFANFYNYNWANSTDSLIRQITINYADSTATTTYGRFSQILCCDDDLEGFQQEVDDLANEWKKKLVNGIYIVDGILGGLCILAAIAAAPPTAGASVGAAGWLCGSFTAASVATTPPPGSIGNAATLPPNTNAHAPASPTKDKVPNPIGTPENPGGSLPSSGSGTATWDVTYSGNSFNPDPYIQSFQYPVTCYTYNCSGQEMMTVSFNSQTLRVPRRNGSYSLYNNNIAIKYCGVGGGNAYDPSLSMTCFTIYPSYNIIKNIYEGSVTIAGNSLTLHYLRDLKIESDGFISSCRTELQVQATWQ